MGILRLLLIFALVYFIVRLFTAYRTFSRIRNQARPNNNFRQRKEGEVSINNPNSQKKKQFHKSDGDYVDFEEIK